jgi:hypothetical protein
VSSIDITEFVKRNRELLFDALVASGIPRENLQEAVSKKAPFGRWNRPVIIFEKTGNVPVAQYYLSYPKVGDEQKTVKFNIATYASVLKNVYANENFRSPEELQPA